MGGNSSKQAMKAPRDIFALAETVKADCHELTEETINSSVWIRSFLQTPKMRNSRERTELLHFLIFTTILQKAPESDIEGTRKLLECIRSRYFCDSQFYQPDIALADIHNVIKDIFSFYYEGQQQQSEFNSIKSKLLLLRQDQVVRGLEPVYGEFLKNKKYHPSEFLEQCILSLL